MLLLDNFLDYLSSFRSQKTVRQKRINLKAVKEFFDKYGETYHFNQETVAKFFRFLRNEKGYKLSTIEAIFIDLKLYLKYLKKQGIETYFDDDAKRFIFSSPTLRNEKEKEQKRSKEVFTKEELKEVLEHIKEVNKVLYYFSCLLTFSGLRLNEALNISIKDFERIEDLKWRVRVKEAKYSKERIALVLIPKEFEDFDEYLKRIYSYYKTTGKDNLFKYKYPQGKKVYKLTEKIIDKFYREISKDLNIKVNAHKFRKTFATLLALNNTNPAILKELLGHSDVKTTLKYYTLAKRFLEEKNIELRIF